MLFSFGATKTSKIKANQPIFDKMGRFIDTTSNESIKLIAKHCLWFLVSTCKESDAYKFAYPSLILQMLLYKIHIYHAPGLSEASVSSSEYNNKVCSKVSQIIFSEAIEF